MVQAAIAELQHAVGPRCRGMIMSRQNHGLLLASAVHHQQRQDFTAGAGIQITGGLIRQQHGRIVGQRPSDGHPLHLAAGELIGSMQRALLETDQGQ